MHIRVEPYFPAAKFGANHNFSLLRFHKDVLDFSESETIPLKRRNTAILSIKSRVNGFRN